MYKSNAGNTVTNTAQTNGGKINATVERKTCYLNKICCMIPKGELFPPLFNKTGMILKNTKKIREKKNQNFQNEPSETCVSKFIHIIVDFCENSTNFIKILMILQLMNNLFFSFPHLIVLTNLGLFLIVLASLSVLFNGKSFNSLFGLDLFPLLLL